MLCAMSSFQRANQNAAWIIDFLTVVVAAMTFWAMSLLGIVDFLTQISIVLLWLAVTVVWLGRALKWSLDRWREPLKDKRRHYGLFPVSTLLLLLGWSTNLPFRCVFRLHRPALEVMAKRIMSTKGDADETPYQVGMYSVSRIEKFPRGVRFAVSKAGFIDSIYLGFAFSKTGNFPDNFWGHPGNNIYDGPHRINSQWFWYTERFDF